MTARPAVFLDRDGVLIEDVDLLTEPSQVRLSAGAATVVRTLRRSGFAIVVVSNQPVVARGLSSEEDVERVQARIAELLEAGGAGVDRFYFCPHHPNATVARYRVRCDCRKPRPGLLQRAARELDLDLARSWMIGDRVSDIAAGRAAGCRTVLVKSGMHVRPPIESDVPLDDVRPDHICPDVVCAVDLIRAST